MDGTGAAIISLGVQVEPSVSSYQINQYLEHGTYRLVIVAPFDVRILVTPVNPVAGFAFHPDTDGAAEIWNSLLVTPAAAQYAFLVQVKGPLTTEALQIQFVLQSGVPEAPPPAPPVQTPPPPPAPPAGIPPAPGDMQDYYRRQGYQIPGGVVEFWYVAFRTSKATGEREICLEKNLSYSQDLHDPARTMGRFPQEDATYRYGRSGPFPNRAQAEGLAIQSATQLFGDPTRYGIWIVSGEMRQPTFS